jgi:hypothetical protein
MIRLLPLLLGAAAASAGTLEEMRTACEARSAACAQAIETILDLHDSRFVDFVHPLRACVPRGTDRAMLLEVAREGVLGLDRRLQINAAEALLIALSRRFPCQP